MSCFRAPDALLFRRVGGNLFRFLNSGGFGQFAGYEVFDPLPSAATRISTARARKAFGHEY